MRTWGILKRRRFRRLVTEPKTQVQTQMRTGAPGGEDLAASQKTLQKKNLFADGPG